MRKALVCLDAYSAFGSQFLNFFVADYLGHRRTRYLQGTQRYNELRRDRRPLPSELCRFLGGSRATSGIPGRRPIGGGGAGGPNGGRGRA